jgi:hypothetical protein
MLNILYIERKNKREKRERKRKHTMDYIVLCCYIDVIIEIQ